MKKVSIYSTPACQYCYLAKDFLKKNNIEFEEFDVMIDEVKRAEMVEKSGQMGVPVIRIGEEVIVGFNEAKLKELLEL
jgi:glutaredoxin 3